MKDASSCAAFARGWMRRKNGALHSAANVFLRLSASTSIASKTSGKKLVALVCEAPAAYKPPGFHKMIPGRPNAHYGWPMASKRGYNSTRNPNRDERTKFAAEKGEKNAKCWGTHPSVPPSLWADTLRASHPLGLPLFGRFAPSPSPTLRNSTYVTSQHRSTSSTIKSMPSSCTNASSMTTSAAGPALAFELSQKQSSVPVLLQR